MRIGRFKFSLVPLLQLLPMLAVLGVIFYQNNLYQKYRIDKEHTETCSQLEITKNIPGSIKESEINIEYGQIRTVQDGKCDISEFDFKINNIKTGRSCDESLRVGWFYIYEPPNINSKYTLYLLKAENDKASFLIQIEDK